MITKTQIGHGVLLAALVLSSSGCRWIIGRKIVVKAEGIGEKSVEVNLVGINKSQYSFWSNKVMSDYWEPSDSTRNNAIQSKQLFVMKFEQNGPREMVLNKDMWGVWKKRNADYVFVMADLPGIHQDQPGNADARRLIIPYDCWRRFQKTMEVILESNGVSCLNECEF